MPGVEPDGIEVAPAPVRGCIVVKKSACPPREPRGQALLVERGDALVATARTIPVAWDADVENVRRTMQNGVLTLSIPKLGAGGDRKKASPTAAKDK